MNTETTIDETCDICGEGYSPEQWEQRHDFHADGCDLDDGQEDWCSCGGRACHEDCCPTCLYPDGSRFHDWCADVRRHSFLPAREELVRVPRLRASDANGRLEDLTLWLHYFTGPCDWWVAEIDPKSWSAFGYVCLGDPQCAEWGYFDLHELEALYEPPRLLEIGPGVMCLRAQVLVERDLSWTPRKATEVDLPGWR